MQGAPISKSALTSLGAKTKPMFGCFTNSSTDRTSGHRRAASTRMGMKLTWPSTVSTTESPSTKNSLLMPSSRFSPAHQAS